ncbi:hypothetical protein [Deinococcus multiflagellatus]|uniref:Uncharacterized protein n=1 Tax=Deinococcus multiflagellatus TaxID=1656887 RepID=A0ABW1ZT47_9DEIO|nr:hypothetical protein [Deinococcus multiflagellatus]MBZ9713614.1 hypothetical protein [Deinococcus multiflagellatus]
MPVWLRLLGVLVCALPLLVFVLNALQTQTPLEVLASLIYVLILGFFAFLLLIVPIVFPPLCWLIGFRPGALAGSGLLGLVGLGLLLTRSSTSDVELGRLLCVHLALCGVLGWEWRGAWKRQRQAMPPDAA